MKQPKVVVMGGGTGTFSVVTALKKLPVSIKTVIAVSDSGGSTGRIRDEFGFQPVGDLRQSLAALADNEAENWIKKILLYRFEKGSGLKGHNLGNLILTALQDMTGNTADALRIAAKIFRLKGTVIPVTDTNVDLHIHYSDGSHVVGEHILDENPEHPKKIEFVSLQPNCSLSPDAKAAIIEADYIIIGPGDYYASIMATLVVDDIPQAFAKSKAKTIYISNLMTRKTQTMNMTVGDHVTGIEKVLKKKLDFILINKSPISPDALALYAKEEEYPVVLDIAQDPRAIQADLAAQTIVQKSVNDTTHRSLIRHDSTSLKTALNTLIITNKNHEA